MPPEANNQEGEEAKAEESKAAADAKKPNPLIVVLEKAVEVLKTYRNFLYFLLILSFIALVFYLFFKFFGTFKVPINKKAVYEQQENQIYKDIKERRIKQRERDKLSLKKIVKESNLQDEIQKANILYSQNQKEEALNIYKQVAIFNQSLSHYNLGVSMMKDKNYEGALKNFQLALKNDKERFFSAFNAAIAALALGNKQQFQYYIDLAESSLMYESNDEAYSLYHTLVKFYKNKPFAALSSILSPTFDQYKKMQAEIAAQIFLMFGDEISSLKYLEKAKNNEDLLNMGLLYANVGDFRTSVKKLERAVELNIEKNTSLQALVLVYLKNNNFDKVASLINKMPRNFDYSKYPIEVFLKKELFDMELAQKRYKEELFLTKYMKYSILMNFAPFELFNVDRTIAIVQKGVFVLKKSEIKMAQEFIKEGIKFSGVNDQLLAGIKLALNDHTKKANLVFQKIREKHTNNSVLEYNLGLTYAQLNDFVKAQDHFRRAFLLDRNNILAGILSLYASDLIGFKDDRTAVEIDRELNERNPKNKGFYQALLGLKTNNFFILSEHLKNKGHNRSKTLGNLELFDSVLHVLIGDIINQNDVSRKEIKGLVLKYPKNMMLQMLALYINNKTLPMQKYALKAQALMYNENLSFNALYYGPNIVRELYVKLAHVTGNLPKVKQRLRTKTLAEREDPIGLLQALGLVNILLQNFENAYVQYNQLIDDFGARDSVTLLYAALASIAADHKENAILLLEVARMQDKLNYEIRYGLGLLYHEINRQNAAAIQYSLVKDSSYRSKYFDFRLKEKARIKLTNPPQTAAVNTEQASGS